MNNYFKRMDKRTKRLWVFTHMLVVVWMVVIFCFSTQIGEDSSDLSGGLCHLLANIVNFVFGMGWDETALLEVAGIISYPVRKIAHMTEFGILAVLIFFALSFYERFSTEKKRYCGAWVLAACYACTDEIHQLFVPDRSGNLFDVGVDSTGALLALLFLYIVRKVYMKFRKR